MSPGPGPGEGAASLSRSGPAGGTAPSPDATPLRVVGAEALGWPGLQALLARQAATPYGREAATRLVPTAEAQQARAWLRETGEARLARAREGDPPWDGVADIRPILTRAAPEGAVLDGPSLAGLLATLRAVGRLRAWAGRARASAPNLTAPLLQLPRLDPLAAALDHALDPEGRLLDRASPRLATVRRQLQVLRAEIQARLDALLQDPALAPALQERYVTVRHGRYVVPVRADARRAVPGIVHDRSQSGATLFVEPAAVVELNNRLTQRLLEERDEETRLLAALTAQVRAHLGPLQALVGVLEALDLALARARLADRMDAVAPELDEAGDLRCPGARHPLLVAQRWTGGPAVVPVDLLLPLGRPALLITGPNAGGKTVALGTLGLLVLMAQAGCHIPAAPGSRLPRFEQVVALIGDDQNLARDLSTFSSFVLQVREALAGASPRTLVLLDELGAGTDPAEGAALGAALVEALLERGARVVATTHLAPLKVFAQTDRRCQNAAVAFDPERLEPTFRLEYGQPGPSYALAIAARLGLPPDLIARARAHLGEAGRRTEALLATLAARERELAQAHSELARREAELAAREAEARAALAEAREAAVRVRQEAAREAGTLLREVRRQAGQALERLRAPATDRRAVRELYRQLQAAEAALAPTAAPPEGDAPEPAGEVEVRGLGLRGRVVARDADAVTVRAGKLTVRVPREVVAAADSGSAPTRTPAVTVSLPARADVPQELVLLGATTDEARAAVEKFLDDAVLAGHDTVRLVHGKGTGALRRAVADCLRGHPLVSAFRPGAPHEGGTGVTVVELAEVSA